MTMATENIKKKYFFIFKNDFPKIDYINRIWCLQVSTTVYLVNFTEIHKINIFSLFSKI